MYLQVLALSEGALPIHLITALFTDSKDDRMMTNRQLSRHLVSLWSTDNEAAYDLLKRTFPHGLIAYLDSDEKSPQEKDRLHVRDNLKLAVLDAQSSQGNTVLRVAGKGLKDAKKVASKTAEIVSEKTLKYTEDALKMTEKHVDIAFQHWREKMGKDLSGHQSTLTILKEGANKVSGAHKVRMRLAGFTELKWKSNFRFFFV